MHPESNPSTSKVVHFLPGILIRRGPADHLPARPLVVDSPHSGRAYPEDFGHAAPLALLRRAFDQLPVEKREILLLSRFQEMKYEEIASVLGCEVGTVKVRVYRAVRALEQIYFALEKERAS